MAEKWLFPQISLFLGYYLSGTDLGRVASVKKTIMRVRITRRVMDDVDGISLGLFQVGQIYDVSTAVGTYLLAMDCAEPEVRELVSSNEIRYGYNVALPPAIAADKLS